MEFDLARPNSPVERAAPVIQPCKTWSQTIFLNKYCLRNIWTETWDLQWACCSSCWLKIVNCSTETCWYAWKSLKRQLSFIYNEITDMFEVWQNAAKLARRGNEFKIIFYHNNLPNYARNFSTYDSQLLITKIRNRANAEHIEFKISSKMNPSFFKILFWRWKLHNSMSTSSTACKNETPSSSNR